ncbi:MAG: acyloxyacyl hydrolase [Burkholderiaceae bacterium]|jgi:hypothetical protein|nr:acyloxyacyl hydrolase [Burkholderiaceae bacterium]
MLLFDALEAQIPATRSPTRLIAALATTLAALAFAAPAAAQFPAPQDFTLAIANGSRAGVQKIELDAGWTQTQPLWQGQVWRVRLRHEIALGAWYVPQERTITEFGYSPVLRLEKPGASERTFFVEGSIGVRLLSHTRLAPRTPLSTGFQFADMLGTGVQFGQGSGAQTVGLRFQHQSNADIKHPNPGINFVMMYYRYDL